jgi:acid stress-induced BolA-like protein IbaG/YrbA
MNTPEDFGVQRHGCRISRQWLLVRLMTTEEIENLIRSGLPDASVRVVDEVGDSNHFAATVVTPAFAGKGLVERHQMVYAALKGAMAERIHALSMKTYTPDEWAKVSR